MRAQVDRIDARVEVVAQGVPRDVVKVQELETPCPIRGQSGTHPKSPILGKGLRVLIAQAIQSPGKRPIFTVKPVRVTVGLTVSPLRKGINGVHRKRQNAAPGTWSRLERNDDALRWYATMNNITNHDSPYLAVSHLRRAEAHERLGEPEKAAEHYREFIDLWRDCDPELRPMVDEARRALERLPEAD